MSSLVSTGVMITSCLSILLCLLSLNFTLTLHPFTSSSITFKRQSERWTNKTSSHFIPSCFFTCQRQKDKVEPRCRFINATTAESLLLFSIYLFSKWFSCHHQSGLTHLGISTRNNKSICQQVRLFAYWLVFLRM